MSSVEDQRAQEPPTGSRTMSGALPEAMNYHRYVYNTLRRHLGRRVWEIGAGYGQYTAMLLADARAVLATDIDSEMLSKLQEGKLTFRAQLTVAPVNLLVEQTIIDCASWAPDSVLCLNVLEHIAEDLRAVRWLFRHLPPGCSAVFLTPALPLLYGFMDAEAGHIRRYTRQSLTQVFTEAGWTVGHSFYMNPVGGMGWFVRNRLFPPSSSDLDSPRVNDDIRLFDRYLVPVTRALDPVFGRFFGQSVVTVARRP